jgi:endonuclease/exonuclease/phosphatase family metal-dependent hydrolase
MKNTLDDMPLIIAGDFNENESKEGIAWLKTQDFTDALSLYDEHSPTWQLKVPLITLKNRYDHVMLSRHLSCTGATVVNVNASDHMPIVAVIVSK